MQKIQFAALPVLVKITTGATLVYMWTLFEREIIEPFGIYHYMPFYRVQGFCVWDLAAIIVITTVLIRMSRT